MINNSFAGWVRVRDLAALEARMGESILSRVIRDVELRYWPRGGGDNYRGTIELRNTSVKHCVYLQDVVKKVD